MEAAAKAIYEKLGVQEGTLQTLTPPDYIQELRAQMNDIQTKLDWIKNEVDHWGII